MEPIKIYNKYRFFYKFSYFQIAYDSQISTHKLVLDSINNRIQPQSMRKIPGTGQGKREDWMDRRRSLPQHLSIFGRPHSWAYNDVKLVIYDILGKEIQTLVTGLQQAGEYSVNFDASKLTSGVYFYQLKVDNQIVESKKMILAK